MSGTIPTEIGTLSQMNDLELREFPYFRGTIPSELGKLSKLTRLNMEHSNGIGGAIPSELFNLKTLGTLALYNTSVSGTLSADAGRLANIKCKLNIGHSPLYL